MDNDILLKNDQQDAEESLASTRNLLNHANELYTQGKFEHAVAFYGKFLLETEVLTQEVIEACGKLSDCYVNCGKEKEALLAAFHSLAYGIPHPEICYKIGVLFMKKNDLNIAIFWFDTATKVTKEQEQLKYDVSFSTWLPHLQLCVCYDRLGDREKSFQHHKLSQSYYPNHPSIIANQRYFDSLAQKGVQPPSPTQEKTETEITDSRETDSALEILNKEQNDVPFTGERVVINDVVKKNYADVLEEHLNRYKLAQKYVKNKRVLDAACGAGYGTKMLQAAGASHVLGVDIDEASLANARKTYAHDLIDYTYGNVNKLELEDKSFDVVVSFETIEHIDDGSIWIKESSRLLKDDGIFIVSTPNRTIANPAAYFVEQPRNRYHKYEYTTVELVGELLKEYDILELYGQTFSPDYVAFHTQVVRQARNMGAAFNPYTNPVISGYELVALGEVKDMNPLYVVAVCQKKRVTQ